MFRLFQRTPLKMSGIRTRIRLLVEQLEPRLTLSLMMGDLGGSDARGGPAPPPAIRLDLVALHELGHSLGLEHDNTASVSIMDPYYNASYNLDNFASDPAVAKLLAIYSNVNTSGWNDANDADAGASDGDVDLTYSFMAGGLRMDGGKPVYSTAIPGDWQPIIVEQLGRWASVSMGKLTFTPVNDGPYAFNTAGNPQSDLRFGDIRIGAHYFDGPSKVLAHAYFPPPNGSTAAGDAHFDNSENWVLSNGITPLTRSSSSFASSPGGSSGSSSSRKLGGSDLADVEADFAVQAWLAGSNASSVAIAPATRSVMEASPDAGLLSVPTAAFAPPVGSASQGQVKTGLSLPATRAIAGRQGMGETATTTDSVARLSRAQLHDLVFDRYTE